MRITFKKHTISVPAKYHCECGCKFTRKNCDWFTITPFTTKTFDECKKEIISTQSIRVRDCPKCKSECSPLQHESAIK